MYNFFWSTIYDFRYNIILFDIINVKLWNFSYYNIILLDIININSSKLVRSFKYF